MVLITSKLSVAQNQFAASGGMAFDVSTLQWSIAGNIEGQSPNILSELNFNTITSLGYFLECRYSPINRLEIVTYYQANKVLSGEGTDFDYSDDNRTNPIYGLSFVSDKGNLNVVKIGVRTPLFKSKVVGFFTALNYLYNGQDFNILSPEEKELRSTYKTKMHGIHLALETDTQLSNTVSVLFSFACAYSSYRAEADWNLRDIFKHPISFLQTSNGINMDGSLQVNYQINSVISVAMGARYGRTKVFRGTDTSFLASNVNVSTQFNGALYTRYGSMLGAKITF